LNLTFSRVRLVLLNTPGPPFSYCPAHAAFGLWLAGMAPAHRTLSRLSPGRSPEYTPVMDEHSSAARRITAVLFAAQCLASAAFIATSTVSALAGAALSGQRSLAGVPAGASTLAGAGAAFIWGLLMDRMGRRSSLSLGLLFGAAGAGLCIWGITTGSFLLFVGGMMLVGVANAAVTLSRFVAAEVQVPERRGRAVSDRKSVV
jgi:hypothetical protein